MGCDVFANMREIACKASGGKSICAFPDVCFTPPQAPPTPPGVPIPYPNTAQASDTSKGTKKVKVNNKEVMLKDTSSLKTSVGNEAGNTPKKGLLTSKKKGKAYFNSWSMDVKFEGKNVVRHLDLTTHNHGSKPGNTPPWPYIASMNIDPGSADDPCKEENEKKKAACGSRSRKEECEDEACKNASKCELKPYGGSGSPNCCPGETGHHLLPNSLLQSTRGSASSNVPGLASSGENAYNVNKGACVCVKGSGHSDGDHGKIHAATYSKLNEHMTAGNQLDYSTAKRMAAEAHRETVKDADGNPQCSQKCLEAQIDSNLAESKTGEIKVRQKNGQSSKNYEPYLSAGGNDR
jgi:hypothetical protein